MKTRLTTATVAVTTAVLALTACGNSTYQAPPPAYGENGACYYVDDPAEVAALQDAGYCPRNWAAAPMPPPWRSRYAYYYDSRSYYETYVPRQRRKTYVTHVRVYEQAHPQAVTKAPEYAASARKTVRFDSGNGRRGGDQASMKSPSSRPLTFNGKSAGSPPRYTSRPKSSSSFKSGSRR